MLALLTQYFFGIYPAARTSIAGLSCTSVLLAALGLSPGVTGAQATADPMDDQYPDMNELFVEEMVVTARKKEETLQKVPVSIAALSSRQLQDRGIANNFDLANFTPNFNTVKQVGRNLDRPTIRGMANPPVRGEPNASYFIDGIFVSASVSTTSTAMMERVEVIRGPQSATFGRATFSGAINYVTRNPTDEFAGEINTRTGTDDNYMVNGWVSGPILRNRLGFVLTAGWENYGGQWHNTLPEGNKPLGPYTATNTQADSSRLGEEETLDFMGKLRFQPFDSTVINLRYSYTKGEDGHFPTFPVFELNCFLPTDPSQRWYQTSGGAYCGEFELDDARTPEHNIPDFENGFEALPGQDPAIFTTAPVDVGLYRDTHRVAFDWTQAIKGFTSTLRVGYSEDDFDSAYDLDHQAVRAVFGLFNFEADTETDDYSVEWTIDSPEDYPIRVRAGAYLYDQELAFRQRSIPGPLVIFSTPPGGQLGDPRVQEIHNQSVFGGLAFDLGERWVFEIEGRYASDEKDIISGQRTLDGVPLSVSESLDFTSFTPRGILRYQATPDVSLYTSVAKGTKPGGFNVELFRSDLPAECTAYLVSLDSSSPTTLPQQLEDLCPDSLADLLIFEEEEQWTYELGMKSTWLDRRLSVNASGFYIDWTNQGLFALAEVPNIGGPSTIVNLLNNAGKSRVIGLELETLFAVTENLFVIMNYGYSNGEFRQGTDPTLTASSTGTDGSIVGNRIPLSPEHSFVFSFDTDTQFSSTTDAFLRGDFIYESDRTIQQGNFNTIGARKLVNLRTGLRTDNWTLSFYVRNLLDDDTPLSALEFKNFTDPDQFDSPNPALDGRDNSVLPNMWALNPQRERDWGAEFQFRFGN